MAKVTREDGYVLFLGIYKSTIVLSLMSSCCSVVVA